MATKSNPDEPRKLRAEKINRDKSNYIRGKYEPARFPMLLEYPDIEPGQAWGQDKEIPPGFKVMNGRIWPVPVKKGFIAPDEIRCTATNKTDGLRCPMRRMKGFTTCRMHGDSQNTGIAHPNVKEGNTLRKGIFGDCMPDGLREFYERAIEDPQIYDLTHNIAALAGRERELFGGMSTGEARASWAKAAELVDELIAATRIKDDEQRQAKVSEILPQLRSVTRTGRNDTEIWAELMEVGDKKRRLIDTERKRRLDLKLVVSSEQMRGLLRAFYNIVNNELNGLPQTCDVLIEREGFLDTGRLALVILSRIGRKMTRVSEGMKHGKLSEEFVTGSGYAQLNG